MSPSLILHHLSSGNNPPLYEWILHDWMGWFGDSALAVRWLSAIFSSITTALMYILGTQISAQGNHPQQESGNARIGLLAALLFLSSNYTTFLAHEARTYNLTLLLGVACTMLFLRAIQKPQTSTWIAYSFVGGILCLSHFFGAWILMAHMGYWLWTAHEKRWVIQSLLWVGLGFGISFGWYIPNLWHRFVDSASQGTWVNPAPWDAPYLTLWKYLNTPAATIIAMILLVYAVVKVVAQPTRTNNSDVQKQHAQLFLWLFALPFFGQWLLSLDQPFSIPMFTERYACITLPFLCLILAMALTGLKEHFNQWLYNVVLPL
ncbi:MAG: glycosyltransferase family 39 protein, partial [Bacteroidota bacterium]